MFKALFGLPFSTFVDKSVCVLAQVCLLFWFLPALREDVCLFLFLFCLLRGTKTKKLLRLSLWVRGCVCFAVRCAVVSCKVLCLSACFCSGEGVLFAELLDGFVCSSVELFRWLLCVSSFVVLFSA